ncbi:MAG: sulfotransferase family protein, partial [Vicinamibacteraceae bacterium]
MRRQFVYIAGYGRSGSTLLDAVLGNHPDVFGAGELTWVFRCLASDDPCSCGQAVSSCGFWRSVMERVRRVHPGLDLRHAAALTLQTEMLFGRGTRIDEYVALWQAVCDAIAEVSGRSILIDSTKSSRLAANRLPLLVERLGVPVKILHVVRDPRAVMWSVRRGSNRRLEGRATRRGHGGMARGLAGWMFSNYVAERTTRRFDPAMSMLLQYEEFVRHPAKVLGEIGALLDVDFGAVYQG